MISYGRQGYVGMRCMQILEGRDPETNRRVRCKCKEFKENPWYDLLRDTRDHDRP